MPDYLLGESFDSGDSFTFMETIRASVLTKFLNFQTEDIFRQISEFNNHIKIYFSFLGLIRLSVSEEYGFMLRTMGYNNEILSLIDSECDEIKNNLGREISIEGRETNDISVSELQSRLNQLDFLRNILCSHKQLCELFEEICPGKTLLVF